MEKSSNAGPFEIAFRARLKNIVQRGKAVGLTVTKLCKDTKIARATPDRWDKDVPLSIKLIDKLDARVAQAEKEAKDKPQDGA